MSDIHAKIEDKYRKLNENPEVYYEGLLHSKPITYWDYIEVDTLLSLQKTRTNFSDEMVFVLYHQLTEILLKMITHEVEQITHTHEPSIALFEEKANRINRYIGICINSFDVMGKGMDPEQYNTFRMTLTPASGFQCASFRLLELMCTDIHNLVSNRYKRTMKTEKNLQVLIQHLYWQDAGKNKETGEKTLMMKLFEEKYLKDIHACAQHHVHNNLLMKYKVLASSHSEEELQNLKSLLKEMDQMFNVDWPLVHLKTAETYLDSGKETTEATGGSDWKKYLHPKYQRRMFFPDLLTEDELANWGVKESVLS